MRTSKTSSLLARQLGSGEPGSQVPLVHIFMEDVDIEVMSTSTQQCHASP
jgi:hypothetical protein